MSSITSVNAILMLSITDVFNSPQRLREFSTDDIYSVEPVQVAEVRMGVDGVLTGGLVNNPRVQNIMLQADSPSNAVFDAWNAQQQRDQEVYYADMVTTLKSLGTKWTHTKGILTTFPIIPQGQKVLGPRQFTITWQSIVPSPT